MSRHLLTAAVLASTLLLAACPSSSTKEDGGTPDAGSDGGVQTDGGDPDAGPPPCASDFDDCGTGQTCNLSTGECVPGGTCNPQYGYANCNYDSNSQTSPGAGCLMTGTEDCVCDSRDDTCKKRRQMCETCVTDDECGSHPNYDVPAYCRDLGGTKVCLAEVGARGCPSGYVPDADNAYCVPASGSCESVFACTKDADCPEASPVCNLTTGTCTRGCSFSLTTGDSTCPTGKVCDEDGRCRAPCDPANDACASIDPAFVCRQDTGGVYRCRHEGCIDTLECDVPDESVPYTGYCDLSTHSCIEDRCRPDNNAVNNENPDCRLGYMCDPDTSQCVKMDCVQRGGATVSCAGPTEICCGECRNKDARGNVIDPNRDPCDPVPCDGTEIDAPDPSYEGCVLAPSPPWCQGCGAPADCLADNPKEDPRDPNYCWQGVCTPTCETNRDCPTFWQCQYLLQPCDPSQSGSCGIAGQCTDDGQWGPECPNGPPDCPEGFDCLQDPVSRKMMCHAANWVCNCAPGGNDASDTNCPQGSRCQLTSATDNENRCVATKVCLPNLTMPNICGG